MGCERELALELGLLHKERLQQKQDKRALLPLLQGQDKKEIAAAAAAVALADNPANDCWWSISVDARGVYVNRVGLGHSRGPFSQCVPERRRFVWHTLDTH